MPKINKETAIFIHIPKSGGSTLKSILLSQYSDDNTFYRTRVQIAASIDELASLESEKKRQILLLYIQHAPYGLHKLLPQKFRYITILRDPWQRNISDYYHACKSPTHSFYSRATQGAQLADFVLYRIEEQCLTNPMTRMISGLGAFSPFIPLPEDALEIAKQNINEHFGLTGTLERYDESLLLLKQQYGWRNVRYIRRNVNRKKPGTVSFPESAKLWFIEANAMDYALYKFVNQRLDASIRENGPLFQYEVERFKKWNLRYQTVMSVVLGVGRHVNKML